MTNKNKNEGASAILADREQLLEDAREWLNDNASPRLIKQYDACRLADFAIEQIARHDTAELADLRTKLVAAEIKLEVMKGYADLVSRTDEFKGSKDGVKRWRIVWDGSDWYFRWYGKQAVPMFDPRQALAIIDGKEAQ